MSQKKTKRFRKEVRKMMNSEVGQGMEALHQIVRARPSWIPKRIWILAYLPLFPKEYLHLVYKHMK